MISSSNAPRGLFDSDPAQTLVLLVDVKAGPASTWPLLVQSLESLRRRGWLTSVRGGKIDTGPVTVVVTGKMPTYVLEKGDGGVPHDIFLDAPLSMLRNGRYHSNNSYWASDSFTKKIGRIWPGGLRPGQLHQVRQHVKEAHSRGLKVRYWGLPTWTVSLRDHVWETLGREGVDIFNVDDLKDVAEAWSRLGGTMTARHCH